MAKMAQRRPMNVQVAPGSRAEDLYHQRKGLPGARSTEADVIVPGVPPTPAHDLIFHGGKTLPNLRFMNFYVGGDTWAAADMAAIDHALAAAMEDPDLNDVMAQYFPSTSLTTSFDGSRVLPGPAPSTVSQGDAEVLAATLLSDGALAGKDLSVTVANLLLPSGTVLTDDAAPTGLIEGAVQAPPPPGVPVEDTVDSLHGLGGYHGSIHPASGAATVYYAIGAYSEQRPDGTTNGIPAFDTPWKNVVATFYHELNEARTDADVGDAIRAGSDPSALKFLGWVSSQGEECGDYPVFEALNKVFQEVPLTDKSGTVPVQFQYSNRVHGPEGPVAAPPGPGPSPSPGPGPGPSPSPGPGHTSPERALHSATREVVLAWLFDRKSTGDTRLDHGLARLARAYRAWEGAGEPLAPPPRETGSDPGSGSEPTPAQVAHVRELAEEAREDS